MDSVKQAILIVGLIATILAIFAIIYFISAFRRISITAKKVDYLVEDLTYKSEMLNATVETVSKVSNYLDTFEVVANKNIKAAIKLVSRNRDTIYAIGERIKELALGEEDKKKKKRGK